MIVDKQNFQAVKSYVQWDDNHKENLSPFKMTSIYLNASREDITVIERNNLPVTIKSHASTASNAEFMHTALNIHENKFTIRRIYTFKNNNIIHDTLRNIMIYNKHFTSVNKELDDLAGAINEKIKNDRLLNNISIIIDIDVKIDELKNKKVMYVSHSDTLLEFGSYSGKYNHPFSPEGFNNIDYRSLISEYKTSGMFIDIVDNDSNIGKRYSFMGSSLMEIPVRHDGSRQNGVYITKIDCDRIDNPNIKQERFDLDKCEELRIYKNVEEAKSGNDNNVIIKEKIQNQEMEILDRKHDISILQQTLDENKRKYELDLMEQTRKFKLLENTLNIKKQKLQQQKDKQDAEIAKIKSRLEKKSIKRKNKFDKLEKKRNDYFETRNKSRNDYYEDRSYTRKDSHELVKYLPAIGVGIIAGVALAFKNSK